MQKVINNIDIHLIEDFLYIYYNMENISKS